MSGGKHVLLLVLFVIRQYEGRSKVHHRTRRKSGSIRRVMGRSRCGGITTQGKDLRELASAIEKAVRCHFAGRTAPREVALHFADNPVRQLA
jgi:hypothetical protein